MHMIMHTSTMLVVMSHICMAARARLQLGPDTTSTRTPDPRDACEFEPLRICSIITKHRLVRA